MLFSALLILVITLVFVLANRKNKLYYMFGIYFISISFLIFTSSLYISKMGNYPYTFAIDYNIFLFLSKIRIPFMTIYRMYLISLAMFMIAPILFYKFLSGSYSNKFLFLNVAVVLPFIFLNDPEISWNLYIFQNTLRDGSLNMLNGFIIARRIYNDATMTLCLLLPVVLLVRYFFQSKLKINKQNALLFCICIVLVDFLIYNLLLKGYFNSININNLDLTNFPKSELIYKNSILTIILSLVIVLTIAALIAIYKPFSNLAIVKKSMLMRTTRSLNKSLNTLLHTYKNAFLGINKLGDMSVSYMDANNPEKARETLSVLMGIAENQLSGIQKSLLLLREPSITINVLDIVSCITSAAEALKFDSKIRFQLTNESSSNLVLGDADTLREVFVNLLQNAVQAIDKKGGEGKIDIILMSENNYLIIDCKDNGIGIPKKNLGSIFVPFYTTKSVTENSGLGLTYIEKVVKAHNGSIEVSSTENVGTTFRIVLPMIKRERGMV